MLEQEQAFEAAETAVSSNEATSALEHAPLIRLRSVTLLGDKVSEQRAPQDTVWQASGAGAKSDRSRLAVRVPIGKRDASGVERFIALQTWVGTVHAQDGDQVTAVIQDWDNPTMPEEEVDFSALEFSPDDRALLAQGTVFYWTIGYRTKAGTRERVSFFQVRRKPPASRSQRERAEQEARALAAMLRGPDPRDEGHGAG